jgi:hypothetical protein
VKNIIGAAVLGADVLFGMALPRVGKGFHAETHAHQLGTAGLYGALALLTLLVIVSLVRTASGGAGDKPAPRAGYGSFGQRTGRR